MQASLLLLVSLLFHWFTSYPAGVSEVAVILASAAGGHTSVAEFKEKQGVLLGLEPMLDPNDGECQWLFPQLLKKFNNQ